MAIHQAGQALRWLGSNQVEQPKLWHTPIFAYCENSRHIAQ